MMKSFNRRQMLQAMLVGSAACQFSQVFANTDGEQEPVRKITGMGLVIYDCNLLRRWLQKQNPEHDLFEPLTFLKHCHRIGAGGMQASLGVLKSKQIEQLRAYAEKHDLYIDAIIKLPGEEKRLTAFEAELQTAQQVGVQAVRTTMIPGRRYEQFQTMEEYREFDRRGRQMIERVLPLLEQYRVYLAVENHKDHRLAERIQLFEHYDHEYLGACIDTGNSFALLDGAYEPIEQLAPYARSVHLKDQALLEYADGFTLGDIPLGQGSFDLKRMVQIIRRARPQIRISLELITRDPLLVPCLTPAFYATLESATAAELARTIKFVKDHASHSGQQVRSLPLEKQVELEQTNVLSSLKYAGEELGL